MAGFVVHLAGSGYQAGPVAARLDWAELLNNTRVS